MISFRLIRVVDCVPLVVLPRLDDDDDEDKNVLEGVVFPALSSSDSNCTFRRFCCIFVIVDFDPPIDDDVLLLPDRRGINDVVDGPNAVVVVDRDFVDVLGMFDLIRSLLHVVVVVVVVVSLLADCGRSGPLLVRGFNTTTLLLPAPPPYDDNPPPSPAFFLLEISPSALRLPVVVEAILVFEAGVFVSPLLEPILLFSLLFDGF
jgi:hypothetical protein